MTSATLVIHPGALGDVLQAVPALRHLGAGAERSRLVFAGQPRLGRLLVELGLVDEARAFDGLGLEALFTDAAPSPTLAALLRRSARVVSWFGSRDATYGRRLRELAAQPTIAPPVPEDETPVWRHLLGSLGVADVPPAEHTAPVALPAALAGAGRRAAPGRPLVVHPGSGGAWKLWPVERFAEVIGRIRRSRSLDVLVHQGPADAAPAQALLASLGPERVSLLVEPELPLLAGALAAGRVYLGSDSGVSHLAAAVGAPSVVLFPPATHRRWAPWNPSAVPVEVRGEAEEVETVFRELASRVA
ncbi:MAG TPA: glycosyltransferase family 9 protein [Candidatus Bathyarchaeia archaeon]|nr:glycosyltransferase family 9 protein [Candidatus Bathyarchaeia archaeon]